MGKITRNEGVQISGGQINAEVFVVGKGAVGFKVSNSLSQVLENAREAILASENLPDHQKREQLQVIHEITREAEKEKPSKGVLKKLTHGLVESLKDAPGFAKTILELTQILSKF